jgi:glycosyltransferase involved in cell wall biosynthesis
VFIDLARAVPEATFWMLAVPTQHPGVDELERLSRETEAIENLQILEPRPRQDVMAVIDRAVAVVNTADYEGMPNIFLEGWARGVPALAYAHDPDGIVERHGLGDVARGSPERLADEARAMWRDRADQAELAQRCREYVAREHSVRAAADAWEEVLGLARSDRARPTFSDDHATVSSGRPAEN